MDCLSPQLPLRLGADEVISQHLKNLCWNTQGQDVAEYAIMLAVVLVMIIGMVRMIGTNASAVFLRLVVQSNSRRMRCFHIVGSLKLILKRRTCLRKRVA